MSGHSHASHADAAHAAHADGAPFCVGAGVTMYMEGFATATRYPGAAGAAAPRAECVTLWFRGWVLDSPGKFAAGCLGVVALGLLVEAIGQLRARFLKLPSRPPRARHAVAIGCHALQIFIGYLLMLAAMTFNAEVFAAVICGLVLGHALGRVYGVGAAGVEASTSESASESAKACCAKPDAGLLKGGAHAPADESASVTVQPAAAKSSWSLQARV